MSAPRKHAEVIIAWASGAEVQCRADARDWEDCVTAPRWLDDMAYRVKPAGPERAKVETLMTVEDFGRALECIPESVAERKCRPIANAALAHAIEAGQVVPAAEVHAAARGLYEQGRAERDIAIAWAVRDACYVAAMNSSAGHEGTAVRQINLLQTIAKVQP